MGLGFLLVKFQMKYLKSLALGVLLIIPGVIDGVIQLQTQYESMNMIRFITGLSGGLGIFLLLFPIKSNSPYKKGSKK